MGRIYSYVTIKIKGNSIELFQGIKIGNNIAVVQVY